MKLSVVEFPFRSRAPSDAIAKEFSEIGGIAARDREVEWAARLREALERSGPIPTALAAYLAARADVLSSAARRQLRPVQQVHRCIPPDSLARLCRREWKDARYAPDVQPVPLWTGPLVQIHRGVLASGTLVRIEVLRHDPSRLVHALEKLHRVTPALKGRLHASVVTRVLQDFRARVRWWLSPSERLAAAPVATPERRGGNHPVVGSPCPELCTERIFVSEMRGDEWRTMPVDTAPGDPALITATWIREALFGSVLPWPYIGEPIQFDGGRLVTHGPVAVLSSATQARLRSFLTASEDAPVRAWNALRSELVPLPHATSADVVERVFRCLVPFRDDPFADGAWPTADRIFLQWRSATEHGWMAPPHLLPFYEGLEAIVRTQSERTADRDVLGGVLSDLRLTTGMLEMQQWMHGADLPAEIEQHIGALLQLPQKIDRLLSAAAAGSRTFAATEGFTVPRSLAGRSGWVRAILVVIALLAWWAPSTEPIRSAIAARPLEGLVLLLTLILLARAMVTRS